MSWKSWLVIAVGVALTGFGIWSAVQRSNDAAEPRPGPTATLAPPSQGPTASTPTASPEQTEPLPPAGEDYGDVPAADIEKAKQTARSFVQAIETYGPGTTVEQALEKATAFMHPAWADQMGGDDPIDDAEYSRMVEAGKTRIVDVQKLFVTSGSQKKHRVVMTVTLRTGWVPASTTMLPASQPAYRMVVELQANGDAWGVSDYRPADA